MRYIGGGHKQKVREIDFKRDKAGVPATVKSLTAGTNPEPRRLFYPLRETQVNGTHVPAGVDVFTTKIFWDVN
jgi:large subunit ribosomal protein L2